uniref:Uncharacterized protein n=2 Tax=Meloidogyne enterolobii TaxID=390850 RepID=A0A6V7WRQ4_MELEN|nr:unnamed protein product [Meloidogyne enterolobii]
MANDSELENDTKLEDDPKLENDPKEKSLIVTQLGKILEKPGLNEQDKAFINAVKEKQTIQEKQIASLTEGHNYILKKQGEMEYDKKNKDEQIKNLTGELAALKASVGGSRGVSIGGYVCAGAGAGAGAFIAAKYGAGLGAVAGPGGAAVGGVIGLAVGSLTANSLSK